MTEVAGITCLQSNGEVYTVGNSFIGRINKGTNPSFNPELITLPPGNYFGLSSTANFLYTVDIDNNRVVQINPALTFAVPVWEAPGSLTLTGFIACARGYIYVGCIKDGIPGVTLTRLTENTSGPITIITPFGGEGTFTLENPLGLVAASDNTVYITDLITPMGRTKDIVTLRIPLDNNGAIVPPVNTSWLTFFGNQGANIVSLFVGTDGNLYIPIDTPSIYQIAKVQPFEMVPVTINYYGPTYSNVLPSPYVSFTYGGGLKSLSNSGLTRSKTIMAVYNCPATSNSMNIQVGVNVSGGAFGIAQKSGLAYTPFQYLIGDLISTHPAYTGINYAFASFDASANNITGMVGFNSAGLLASAFPNNIANSKLRIGDPSNTIYTASGFRIYELIAISNAISTSDRQDVEGYLASKWGLTLPSSHPYKNFQPSGDQWIPPTLPTTISGLVSWLDMTYPGQTTSSIVDRVSGSFTVNVAGGNQFQLSNINNLPTLYFPGTNNSYLYKTSLPPTAEGSVLFVFNITDTRSDLPILAWRASTGTPPWGPLLTYSGLQTLTLQNNYVGTTDEDKLPVTFPMATGTNLVFFAWDNSNSYLSVNGGTPVVGSNAIPGSATTMYVGTNIGTTNSPTMNFGELVVYNQYFEQSERQLLEGYLAWKWSIVSKLPNSHPFSKESPIGDTVSETAALNIPAQIASLTTWLDAADSSTIKLQGTSVKEWSDKSATSDVFTGTNFPTYSNTGGPFLPGVYFEGVNSLRGTVDAAIQSGVGTCFMLATITGNNGQVFTGGYVSGTPKIGDSFGLMCVDKSVTCPFQSDARVNRNPLPGTLNTTPTVLFARIDENGRTGEGSYGFATPVNQKEIIRDTETLWQPSVPSASPWNLGFISTNPALQDFYLHEFLCFSEYFTDSQRFVVEGYLAWKWGIQSQLPVGHPYKNARPQSYSA